MNPSRRNFIQFTTVAAMSAAAGLPRALGQTTPKAAAVNAGPRRVQSISALTFAPDGKLIVADWRAGALHALDLPPLTVAEETSFNLLDLGDRLAAATALPTGDLRVTAAALHGASQTMVLALALGRQADAAPALALVNPRGEILMVEPDERVAATQPLAETPTDGSLWNRQSVRTLTVTDLKAYAGELLVAGLTNSTFSSAFRRVPYPFTGTGGVTAVEMYHAVHNQIETRAPVRAFNVVSIAGEPTLLAAYTCTPLVTVPLSALQPGARVRGKTIAELGFGNTPLDVVPFSFEYKGKSSAWVLVAHSSKSADLISMEEIVRAAQGEGLSTPVSAPFQATAGVRTLPLPLTHVQRVLDQSPQFLVALRREPAGGQLQLVSIRKGAFFRLSDFINEYDFASYAYPPDDKFQQDYIRPFHRLMKTDEGHAALIK